MMKFLVFLLLIKFIYGLETLMTVKVKYDPQISGVKILNVPFLTIGFQMQCDGYHFLERRIGDELDENGVFITVVELEKIDDENFVPISNFELERENKRVEELSQLLVGRYSNRFNNRPRTRTHENLNQNGNIKCDVDFFLHLTGKYAGVSMVDDISSTIDERTGVPKVRLNTGSYTINMVQFIKAPYTSMLFDVVIKGKYNTVDRSTSNNGLLVYALINLAADKVREYGLQHDGGKQHNIAKVGSEEVFKNLPNPNRVRVIIERTKVGTGNGFTFYGRDSNVISLSFESSWKPVYILHEYGHKIMAAAYNTNTNKLVDSAKPDPNGHSICSEKLPDIALAWSEGYATGFSLIMMDVLELNVPRFKGFLAYDWFTDTNTMGYNMENYCCPRLSCQEEGRIAAMLYDLYDDGDDSLNNNKHPKGINMCSVTFSLKYVKEPVDISWYGKSDGDIKSSKFKLDPKDILITPLLKCEKSTMDSYVTTLRTLVQDEQLAHVCGVLKYNYYTTNMNDCKTLPLDEEQDVL